jgi:hypothetical protein
MGELLPIAPERPDVRVHHHHVLEAGDVEPVADVGHAHALEQLDEPRVLFGAVLIRLQILFGKRSLWFCPLGLLLR